MINIKTAPQAVAEAPAAPKFWPTVGAAWVLAKIVNGKQMISVKTNDGQRFILRERLTKRPGKRDPDFDLCLPA